VWLAKLIILYSDEDIDLFELCVCWPYQERSDDALTQANMSYSLERNTHKAEIDKLSASLSQEKAEREKADKMVSSFNLPSLRGNFLRFS